MQFPIRRPPEIGDGFDLVRLQPGKRLPADSGDYADRKRIEHFAQIFFSDYE